VHVCRDVSVGRWRSRRGIAYDWRNVSVVKKVKDAAVQAGDIVLQNITDACMMGVQPFVAALL
jgi:hypothetical protein